MKSLGEDVPGYKIRDMVKEVDIDENGTVEFNEFIEVRLLLLVQVPPSCTCTIIYSVAGLHVSGPYNEAFIMDQY